MIEYTVGTLYLGKVDRRYVPAKGGKIQYQNILFVYTFPTLLSPFHPPLLSIGGILSAIIGDERTSYTCTLLMDYSRATGFHVGLVGEILESVEDSCGV